MAWIIGVSRIEIQSCRKIATNYAQNLARHRCHLHAAFSKTNSENSTKLGSTWGFQRRYHASCNQPSNIGITIKIYGISGYLIGKWCFFMELTVQNKKITISWGFKNLTWEYHEDIQGVLAIDDLATDIGWWSPRMRFNDLPTGVGSNTHQP